MNEIERAVSYFERRVDLYGSAGEAARAEKVALEALQEKLERMKGCKACIGHEVIAWDLCNDGIGIDSDGKLHMLSGGDWEAQIRYCPMCGRQLSESAPSAAQDTTTP